MALTITLHVLDAMQEARTRKKMVTSLRKIRKTYQYFQMLSPQKYKRTNQIIKTTLVKLQKQD